MPVTFTMTSSGAQCLVKTHSYTRSQGRVPDLNPGAKAFEEAANVKENVRVTPEETSLHHLNLTFDRFVVGDENEPHQHALNVANDAKAQGATTSFTASDLEKHLLRRSKLHQREDIDLCLQRRRCLVDDYVNAVRKNTPKCCNRSWSTKH